GMFTDALPNPPAALAYNKSMAIEFARAVPANQPYSQPFWLVKPPTANVYMIDDQTLVGLPDTAPVLQVRLRLTAAGAPIEIVRPVRYRYAGRAEGERERPLIVVPEVSVELPDNVAIFTSTGARKVKVAVKSHVAKVEGDLRLAPPAGWRV